MATTKSGIKMKGISAGIPIEWIGPAVWRLPSGTALAEFALQAGFLAPLLLGDGPFWRRKKGVSGRTSIAREDARQGGEGLRS